MSKKTDEQIYEYMLLGRLKSDCEYFTKTSPHLKHLWAGNIKDQIAKMKELWQILKIKPEWITMNQIEEYEQKMVQKLEQFQTT